jgi:indole-3-glycerol phosphate synthase
MTDILETIYRAKLQEVSERKTAVPEDVLSASAHYHRPCLSMRQSLQEHAPYGIIAEFKRRSPSKGDLGAGADVAKVTGAYVAAGAAALSVLTDAQFFGAQADDFAIARQWAIPILRKDFIVDPYQLVESKAMGADVVLLIAGLLSKEMLAQMCVQAQALGMEVLLETHTEEEVVMAGEIPADMIGINNRNLRTFRVDVENSKRLCRILPENTIKIAESGLDREDVVRDLAQHGFRGFLMGEHFMRGADVHSFINRLRHVD